MKPRIRLLAAAAALLALSACERTVTLDERSLVGTWRADEHYSDPGTGAKDQYAQLTFSPGGAYRYEYFMFGGYGKPDGTPTGYFRTDGAYRLNGGKLELKEEMRFYQDPSNPAPPNVETLSGDWADAGTVTVDGDHLVRRYYTYPADAPELTVVAFTRVTN